MRRRPVKKTWPVDICFKIYHININAGGDGILSTFSAPGVSTLHSGLLHFLSRRHCCDMDDLHVIYDI